MNNDPPLSVFCDGGARGNPGPGAAGWVIENPAGNVRYLCGKYLGEVTNNQAEYAAVELALQKLLDLGFQNSKVQFFIDSLLVVNQLNGLYRVKNPLLGEKVVSVRGLERSFKTVVYKHVRREKNQLADKMVNEALDKRESIEIREEMGRRANR